KSAAKFYTKDPNHQIEMAGHHPHPLLESRFWKKLAGVQKVESVAKNPWIIKSAAANADPRAAGILEHLLRRLRRGDIAVADGRNVLHRLHDGANASEIDTAGKSLLPSAAMDEDSRYSGVFQGAGQLGGGHVL